MRKHGWSFGRLAWVWLLVLTVVPGCLSGCGRTPPPPARDVLEAMCAAAGTMPVGEVYDRASDPAGKGYLSDVLFAALYGPAARGRLGGTESDAPDEPAAPAMIPDAAVFLSSRQHPAELAVLRCADADGALTAASLCRLRLDSLRDEWQGTDCALWVDRADVTVEGCYVLMAVVPDPEAAFDAARRVIASPQRRGSTRASDEE